MKEQWRSSQPSEQEPPAAQQSEAIPGVDAALEEISHEETVCEGCGRPYGHARKLGERGLREEVQKMAKEHALDELQDDNENREIAWWDDYSMSKPRKEIAVLDTASRDKSQGFTVIQGKTRVYPIRVGEGRANREIAKRLRLPKDD